MEVTDTPAPTSNGVTTAIAITFLALVICLPLILFVIRVWLPLKVNAGATRLAGWYSGWSLTHVTGVVLHSRRHTQTTTTTQYSTVPASAYQGAHQTATTTTRTDVYDTLHLRRPDGHEETIEVVNFNVSAWPGQIASIWTAVKGSRRFTFAVFNHSVGQQFVNDQQVFKVMLSPAWQIVFVIYLIFSVFPIVFFSVFGGACVPLLLWLALFILFFLGQRRVRRRFGKKGLGTIGQRSWNEAQPLLQQR